MPYICATACFFSFVFVKHNEVASPSIIETHCKREKINLPGVGEEILE